MSRSPSRKSVWNSQYHAPACRLSLKITLGLRRSSMSVTWSLTKASCSLKRVSTQSAKSPVWWDLPPFTIFQGNSSSSSVSLRQTMQRRFTISSICKAYGYHNTQICSQIPIWNMEWVGLWRKNQLIFKQWFIKGSWKPDDFLYCLVFMSSCIWIWMKKRIILLREQENVFYMRKVYASGSRRIEAIMWFCNSSVVITKGYSFI